LLPICPRHRKEKKSNSFSFCSDCVPEREEKGEGRKGSTFRKKRNDLLSLTLGRRTKCFDHVRVRRGKYPYSYIREGRKK